MIRALLGKAERDARGARAGDAQGTSFPGGGALESTPVYTVWSGTAATVHRRIVLGIPNHGIGAELS